MLFVRPMMVITQKITSLAFEIHDGKTSIRVEVADVTEVTLRSLKTDHTATFPGQ